MSSHHLDEAKGEIERTGEITLYRLNKATYNIIHYLHKTKRDVDVVRDGELLVRIVAQE